MTNMQFREFYDSIPDGVKLLGDGMSIVVVFGTLVSVLPPLAAFMTIIWTAIRIYETDTVQKLLPCNRNKK